MSHLVQKKYDYDRYQFAICESCYWTATIFDICEKQDLPCPICRNDQIALIPLSMNEEYCYTVKPERGLDIEFMIRNVKRNNDMS
ncbi:MAG: hypothetical protein WB612_10835 [Nitrososphaeraceae archaeon]